MERRHLLTGFLALAAGPALAQSSPAPPTDAPAAPAPAAPTAPAAAPAMKVDTPLAASEAVARHREKTRAVGALSLALSRIAVDKAEAPALKQFAKFEVAEQEVVASVLAALMTPNLAPLPTVKPPTNAELMGLLDANGKASVTGMAEMKPGKTFDRDYAKAQVEGHKALLAIQENYLKTPDSLAETNLAKLARVSIEEHLVLLADIERKLG